MRRLAFWRVVVAACGVAVAIARAGGPLSVCDPASGSYTPVKYPGAGAVTLHYDGGGNLGTRPGGSVRTNSQADTIVGDATALWTGVPTATFTFSRGSDLPVDVTAANYGTYYGVYNDGRNPVIYDDDGSIIIDALGAGNENIVLGFAGSAYSISGTTPRVCQYVEGQAVINGHIAVSDATLTNVLAHELGHLIGLDHTQLDAAQGLAMSNYPLMYPIAHRTLPTLHEDDVAAVSGLYPDATVGTTYGMLEGDFQLADGMTRLLGANIWAKENTSGKVFSVVSDYLRQGTGYFRMLLPPGTYTLHAEAVQTRFTEGSSVGPYSESSTDLSFQAPLYALGTAMAPLTLGNASPIPITITAGCTASATLRFNGTGGVSGNCTGTLPDPPRLTNLSTRMQVLTGNDVMIGGFIVGGSSSKTVVVRARGPSLVPFGIANALANPTLQLVRSSDSTVLATNDDWQGAPNASAITASGFAPSNALESAILMTLPPGGYTAIVHGTAGGTGVGIVEVFEVDALDVPLLNISTRGQVRTGNDVMIGGFVVQGSAPQTVMVRARGPSLVPFGIPNALANPVLRLVRSSDSTVLATNDDWQSASNVAAITQSGFAPSNPLESAILITLDPGAYTAIVSGAGGTTGVGIVEVFTE